MSEAYEAPIPAQPHPLPEGCPKCGATVFVRHWEGKFYAKCSGAGCLFGFDADGQGRAVAKCCICKTGRLRTTSKGRVCADCGKWEVPRIGTAPATLGLCPKCKVGQLAQRGGQYGPFVSCSAPGCGLLYACDDSGNPASGRCSGCQGPVKKTKSGAKVCAVCGTWQEAKAAAKGAVRPPKPPQAICPVCRQPLRVLWTKRNKWAYRCDPCDRWTDAQG